MRICVFSSLRAVTSVGAAVPLPLSAVVQQPQSHLGGLGRQVVARHFDPAVGLPPHRVELLPKPALWYASSLTSRRILRKVGLGWMRVTRGRGGVFRSRVHALSHASWPYAGCEYPMTLPARWHCSAVGVPRQPAVPDARQHARFALVAALPRSLGCGPPVMSSSGFLRASACVCARALGRPGTLFFRYAQALWL